MSAGLVTRVERAVFKAIAGERVVLAVSGGIDSMVLLEAAMRVVPDSVAAVANFDHRTGAFAREAARLVQRRGRELGAHVVCGEAPLRLSSEAKWREQRWHFLRDVCEVADAAAVVTAHTRDDHVETVAMRILRGSGARGLAALYADGAGLRPLIQFGRSEIRVYADQLGVPHLEDPSNSTRRHLRNRVRLDLLPALKRFSPELDESLLSLSARAAQLRADIDGLLDTLQWERISDSGLALNIGALRALSEEQMRVLTPGIAARAGVTVDRRGVARLSQLLRSGAPRSSIQLSGGASAEKRGDLVLLLRTPPAAVASPVTLDEESTTRWGRWLFAPVTGAGRSSGGDGAWRAKLPLGSPLRVRAWVAGDRMEHATPEGLRARRVKRFLSDAGVAGQDRIGWPVVLAGDRIVWIPGVRVSDAGHGTQVRREIAYECRRAEFG